MTNLLINPYQLIGSVAIATSWAIAYAPAVSALDFVEIANIAYEITVRVIDSSYGYNGSGVIFKQEGNVYSVLTNQHVVSSGSQYEIQTVDGLSHPIVFQQNISGLDLVVLQFESEELYEVADLGDSEGLSPLQTIYVSGFPVSQSDLDLTVGAIRTINQEVMADPASNSGYALVYTNQTLPGSSGGAVLDEDGKVIAINGQAERDMVSGRDLSRGIPINLFKSLSLDFSVESEAKTESESEISLEDNLETAYVNYSSSYFLAYNPIGHDRQVNSVAVSGDGQLIASGSDDKTINIWSGTTGALLRTLEGHTKGIKSLAFAADGSTLVSGSDDKTIKVWNASTGEQLRSLEGHTKGVNSVAIAPDGRTLVSGSDDHTVMVWDWLDWELKAILEEHTKGVNSVAIALDGRTIVSGSDDQTVMVWDWQTLEMKANLAGHEKEVNSVAIAPDGRTIVSGSDDRTVRVWDWTTWELKLAIEAHEERVNSVLFSSDGKTIFSSSDDRSIRSWNLSSGELKQIFSDRNSAQILDVGASNYENILVGAGEDSSLRIWYAK